MPSLSHSYRSFIEVIRVFQGCPQIRKCQYYCTQHTSSLSQSEANYTFATHDVQTNSKSQTAITALSSFSGYVSTIKCAGNVVGCSCHIFKLNCAINCKWQFFSCATVAFCERYNYTVCCRPSCDYSAFYFPILSHSFPSMPQSMYFLKPSVT
jgi:hypothetical protein